MNLQEKLNHLELQKTALSNDIESIKNKLTDLDNVINNLKSQISNSGEENYKNGLLIPRDGKTYYYFTDLDYVIKSDTQWDYEFEVDIFCVDNGLVFFTKEEAKTHKKKLLAFSKCLSAQKYLNGDWKPDWNDKDQDKYYIDIACGKKTNVDFCSTYNLSMFCFKDRELVEKFYEWCKPELITLEMIEE
jgi:glucan-binding YG repeat protein